MSNFHLVENNLLSPASFDKVVHEGLFERYFSLPSFECNGSTKNTEVQNISVSLIKGIVGLHFSFSLVFC